MECTCSAPSARAVALLSVYPTLCVIGEKVQEIDRAHRFIVDAQYYALLSILPSLNTSNITANFAQMFANPSESFAPFLFQTQ